MSMSLFAEYPLLTLFAVAVTTMVLMSVLSPRRRTEGAGRMCGACGAAHPEHAAFCRRCGRSLGA